MVKKIDFQKLGTYRHAQQLNQSEFWRRFGVTQSGGSRYESGRNLPKSVAMLIWLRDTNRLTDKDLDAAKKAITKK